MFLSLSKPFLIAWLSISEWYLLVFGVVLLGGLIGEITADREVKKSAASQKLKQLCEESENLRLFSPRKSTLKKHKHFCEWLVVIGVLGKVFSEGGVFILGRQLQIISERENAVMAGVAAQAKKEAGQANERASTNELAAKQLEKQVNETKTQLANAETHLIELKNANLPMDIGDQYSFANTLKPLAGMQVELRSAVDTKAQETAESLFSTFAMAGWPVINRSLIGDIGKEGIIIGYNFHAPIFENNSVDDSSKNAAYLLLKLLTERNIPSEIIEDPTGFMVRGVPTNALIVAVCPRPSQLKADLMVVRAKETELRHESNLESPKIWARIIEISTNRYIVGSKELADAQAEYNDLNSQIWKLRNEQAELDKQEKNLDDQVFKEEFGTNSMTRGFHSYGDTFFGVQRPMIIAPTNTRIEMRGVRINPQPLQ